MLLPDGLCVPSARAIELDDKPLSAFITNAVDSVDVTRIGVKRSIQGQPVALFHCLHREVWRKELESAARCLGIPHDQHSTRKPQKNKNPLGPWVARSLAGPVTAAYTESMTEASVRALQTIRDFSMLKWYVIPLLALVLYIYAVEIRKARASRNWDPVLAGLTLFGMDLFNETWNGWVLAISGHSALWTTPGDTALRVLVGLNIEIMFMFAIAGIVFYHMCPEDRTEKILGLPARWFWAIAFSAFCVLVECVLNAGGLLVWEYRFWNRSLAGIWLILVIGYFEFFAAINIVLGLSTIRKKVSVIGVMYAVPAVMNVIGFGIMGWRY